jgi:hypothetical protein
MTRVAPRTNFHSSRFIRCLSDLALVDAGESDVGFAQQLGLWIQFIDSITLSTVVNGEFERRAPVAGPALQDHVAASGKEYERVLASLTNSIARSFVERQGKTHIELPSLRIDLPVDFNVAFLPYRRFHEAHQRDMAMNIQPLRVNLRLALARVSPALKKLAELDATLENALRERENKLLGKVPLMLRQRFEQLYCAHALALEQRGQADNPALWDQGDGWLARFCSELNKLLLAELELRLLPATGLLEALGKPAQSS